MPESLILALAQLNPTVGDIRGNVAKVEDAYGKAVAAGSALLVTSELVFSGYPPEDLVLKPSFMCTIRKAVEDIARQTSDGQTAILLGVPWKDDGKIYNAALLLENGAIKAHILKHDLPNYGPFDEKRVFTAGPLPEPVEFRGHKLGVMICEDMWTPDAAAHLKKKGAEILIVPNGSPFEGAKYKQRQTLALARVQETGLPLVYVNQVGGQDELVFDGASFALDASGAVQCHLKPWQQDFAVIEPFGKAAMPIPKTSDRTDEVYNALVLGLRDYVVKNGFPGVVLGLSGGIDSALVAALAADALGPNKVWCVMMPSPYTSQDSLDDAAELARNLKSRHDILPIIEAMKASDSLLAPIFANSKADVTEENIQARLRGITLMALSNKFGAMVISTGNKSEMSVGYSTLYGDLCGGYALLKDVYKTEVYRLARWRNEHKPETGLGPMGKVIPERILTKAPTAELRPNQKDQDSLPPYDVLDDILSCLIEGDMGIEDVVARGHDAATVAKIWSMLDRAEYKRRQAPPGVKITSRILGRDRRYPITNGYRETD